MGQLITEYDYDVWYKPCEKCGYDTAKSTKPKDGNKTCWSCGNFVYRDFTKRALKNPNMVNDKIEELKNQIRDIEGSIAKFKGVITYNKDLIKRYEDLTDKR